VIALQNFAIGQREFRIELAKKEREEDRRLSGEEFHEFYQSHADVCQRTVLRALVYLNPYARKGLPDEVFTGSFDERWGPVANQPDIKRFYVGAGLAKLEGAEHELELDLGPLQKRKKRQRERGK
jgi:hypothetical protein